ncbi:MAG TPA: hypothetical protein P5186_29360 [Candidatus Paceibacterota bacterium]|nr:hypothetical protein [Verrucomicrobiota bacterium]HRY52156.1 hypothetical protein [Candidatus Paceibacterota bacterium]
MNAKPENKGHWFGLGLLGHLVLLAVLFGAKSSLPESWRGRVLVPGSPGGAPWGAGPPAVREVRDHDAMLLGLVALTSIVVTLLVVCLSWNRRRSFGVGFAVPAIWGIIHLLK